MQGAEPVGWNEPKTTLAAVEVTLPNLVQHSYEMNGQLVGYVHRLDCICAKLGYGSDAKKQEDRDVPSPAGELNMLSHSNRIRQTLYCELENLIGRLEGLLINV